jgi:hypothetical protein
MPEASVIRQIAGEPGDLAGAFHEWNSSRGQANRNLSGALGLDPQSE